MDHEGKAFLGRGWSFPPSFDRINNANQMSSGLTDIEESIRIILGTTPGERIMQPKFGCDIKKMVFEQLSTNLITQINHIIAHALLNFEPRIMFIQAELLEQANTEGMVHMRIDYSVITTNTRHNIVYPFYLAEGTNVSF
ncbi:GPW/gp25 family protein [Pedobacter sp. L105]|uniref:GPW/gp25 family protein n=1 Tax=Pedobacter sp. L105 TaxID=1641871 RepID=UPI00131A60FE|nr:GPW/gp25 family protein [Pedobacter sp. L105]